MNEQVRMFGKEPGVALVVGGSGFIGGHLRESLVLSGWETVILDVQRPSKKAPTERFVEADIRGPLQLPNLQSVDLVVNLAAVHRTPGHQDAEYYDTNVGGAINVLRWCTAHDVSDVFFTSSIAVYGAGEETKAEATAPSPNTAYGKSKLLAEEIHLDWASGDSERRLSILRPAVVFGPGEHGNFTRLAKALKHERFVYPGRKDTTKSCGYVKDLVRAASFVHTLGPISVANFCYPDPPTIKDVVEAICAVGGYKTPRALPRAAVDFGLKALDWTSTNGIPAISPDRVRKLLISTNVAPTRLIQTDFRWSTDLGSALADWYAISDGAFV